MTTTATTAARVKGAVALLVRLVLATACGLVYEQYWFNKEHILGYLWLINHFHLKERQVPEKWAEINTNYPITTSLWVNFATALSLWILYYL